MTENVLYESKKATEEPLMRMEVGQFIKTIQENLDEANETFHDPTAPAHHSPDHFHALKKSSRNLPEIKTTQTSENTQPMRIQNIKQLVMRDLEQDGVRRINIPFS